MMRRFGKWLGRLLLVLIALGAALWALGPYEPTDLKAEFDSRRFGEGVQVYFESVESGFDDLTEGTMKRVVWQPGFYERRTPVSVVYLHGWSATSEEIRPVPDRVAEALGANLVYTRLKGHGRDGAALDDANVNDWVRDTAEALAAGRAVGERVIVIGTSTGATLAVAALADPDLSRDVAAAILVSPNFGINDPAAFLLSFPAARFWLPLIVGPEIVTTPANEGQAKFWTNRYPTTALLPVAALVGAVLKTDFAKITTPALFWLSDDDKVVRQDVSREVAGKWGGPVQVRAVTMGPQDTANSHVIAGDILSPGQTDLAVSGILEWLHQQGIR